MITKMKKRTYEMNAQEIIEEERDYMSNVCVVLARCTDSPTSLSTSTTPYDFFFLFGNQNAYCSLINLIRISLFPFRTNVKCFNRNESPIKNSSHDSE